jgi:hypothetical protein
LLTTYFVDNNPAISTRDGNSWNTAYADLQLALAAAVSGDTVRVANGVYKPTATTDPSAAFVLKNGVSLLGGYAGFAAADPDARNPTSHVSTLSGDVNSSAAQPDSYHVVLAINVDASALLDGFTIRDGQATRSSTYADFGGGMYCSASSPTVNNCRFTANRANKGSGVAVLSASAPAFTHCAFDANVGTGVSWHGEGIYCDSSSLTVSDCTFANHSGSFAGTAMYNNQSSATLRGCTFRSNAGPMRNFDSSMTLVDCQFLDSTGSANDIEHNAGTLRLTNCSFVNSQSPAGTVSLFQTTAFITDSLFLANAGGGVRTSGGSTTISSCRFEGNQSSGGAGARLNGAATVTDCLFIGNISSSGGALLCDGIQPISIDRCIMQGNIATEGGAFFGGMTVLSNCLIVGNRAVKGGGICIPSAQPTTLVNCTIAYNTATTEGGGIYQRDNVEQQLLLKNSIIWGNTAESQSQIRNFTTHVTLDFCDVQGGWSGLGDNNFNADPQFLRTPDPGDDLTWATADDGFGDLRVQPTSPVVDVGDNAAVPVGITKDLLNHPRILDQPGVHDPGAIVDIGAYEVGFFAADGSYRFNDPKPTVAITFNSDMDPASLSAGELILRNLDTNQLIDTAALASVSYDATARTASWSFPSALPDGNYRATLPADAMEDTAGRPLSSEITFEFFVLGADANHDRRVDVADFKILSANYMGADKTFATGDFDYDGDCDNADLSILSINWNRYLAPYAPPAQPQPVSDPAPPPSSSSARRTSKPKAAPLVSVVT